MPETVMSLDEEPNSIGNRVTSSQANSNFFHEYIEEDEAVQLTRFYAKLQNILPLCDLTRDRAVRSEAEDDALQIIEQTISYIRYLQSVIKSFGEYREENYDTEVKHICINENLLGNKDLHAKASSTTSCRCHNNAVYADSTSFRQAENPECISSKKQSLPGGQICVSTQKKFVSVQSLYKQNNFSAMVCCKNREDRMYSCN